MIELHRVYCCDHCQGMGTTVDGGLWRWSSDDDSRLLYYLHSCCLSAYKSDNGLRSVEGRVPLVVRDAPVV